MKTEIIQASEPGAIEQVLAVLRRDGLVAFPTDTVYGLAASAFSVDGIRRIFKAKGRESVKAIPVLLGDTDQLPRLAAEFPIAAWQLAGRFWPGPLTIVVPRSPDLPEEISPSMTIGLRIPDHPVALALLRRAGPLATTSANRSGKPEAITAEQVFAQLAGGVDLVVDGGASPGGVPSTVVDCTGPEVRILRVGPISAEAIHAIVGE